MEDVELINRCKRGEKAAFSELIAKYHPYVHKYLLKASEDPNLAEDLVQESFIKIIRSMDQFDPHGTARFSTYLIAVARNCLIDHYRRERKRAADVPLEEAFAIEAEGKPLQELVGDKLQQQEILEWMEQLPREQRIVIRMKYFEDLTLKEIGAILLLEPKTIKSRIHNGIVKLRRMMKGGSMDEGN